MMEEKIRAIIWDMGGVLLRTEDQSPRQKIVSRLGITLDELFNVVFFSETGQIAERGEMDEEAHWQAVGRTFKLSENELNDLRADFWAGDRMDQTLIEFIDALRPRFKTAILSNAWSGARESVTRRFSMLNAFDIIIFSAEVGLVKPDERIYRLILNELEVEPHQAIFIDDTVRNVDGAQRIGIHSILFKNREQVVEELNGLLK